MIHTSSHHFKDTHNRTLLLRGVNLGGSSKVPAAPDGATYIRDGFFDHRAVSFVGRPFSLDEADEHFTRLRAWGLTCLRFLVTWEAVEHAGPGIYDADYLDYLTEVVAKAGEYGLTLFIDPHEDVWSRFSGGDGAPGWTFEAVGLDITHFHETGAAVVHATHGDPFPRMIWPTNNARLAAATMWALFFGGDDFAPAAKVDGVPVQTYLQRHYIAAMQQIARRLKDFPHVIGYDTLNEPASGYIGWPDLTKPRGQLKLGPMPTPFQAMLLGAGIPQEIDTFELRTTGPKFIGRQTLNPNRQSAWLPGHDCVWRQNGVWDLDDTGAPRLLRPDHFSRVAGREIDFNRDYFNPFAKRFAAAIREIVPGTMIFVESEPEKTPPHWDAAEAQGIVSAPHWYDGATLMLKDFNPLLGVEMHTGKLVFGPWAVRRSFARQVKHYKETAIAHMGNIPTLIGEFGIPFDLQHKRAYRTGNFTPQMRAMDRVFRAMEDALVSCTLWNYTADNDHAHGDQWNDEDLSIFSRDDQSDPADINSGGRALEAVVRPYARATAGEPLRMSFDLRSKTFEFVFRHDPAVSAPTEIFVPRLQYPRGCRVSVSDGAYEFQPETQTLLYHHSPANAVHAIRISS